MLKGLLRLFAILLIIGLLICILPIVIFVVGIITAFAEGMSVTTLLLIALVIIICYLIWGK